MTLKYISHKQCDGDWMITCDVNCDTGPIARNRFFGDGSRWWSVSKVNGGLIDCYQERFQSQLTDICARLRWEEKRSVLE